MIKELGKINENPSPEATASVVLKIATLMKNAIENGDFGPWG